ncbi:MAG: Crp/Fnr family transcriptional regulator [Sandaracinus sp.]
MRPTEEDRETFARAMRALAPLTPAELAEGLALVRVRELARGERLLRAHEQATDVAVVVKGLLREHFVLEDGTERTKAFVLSGEASGSLADLLSGAPSRAFIVAEEPTRLLVAPYAALRALGARSPAWAAVGRASVEQLLLRKAEREWELLALDAEQRYARFRERHPGLEARTLARHVASYLGITPAHLSRLRARRRAR